MYIYLYVSPFLSIYHFEKSSKILPRLARINRVVLSRQTRRFSSFVPSMLKSLHRELFLHSLIWCIYIFIYIYMYDLVIEKEKVLATLFSPFSTCVGLTARRKLGDIRGISLCPRAIPRYLSQIASFACDRSSNYNVKTRHHNFFFFFFFGQIKTTRWTRKESNLCVCVLTHLVTKWWCIAKKTHTPFYRSDQSVNPRPQTKKKTKALRANDYFVNKH